jgi:hypothetical protein
MGLGPNANIIKPTDDSANKLGGNSRGPVQPITPAEDTHAEMLGKTGARSGANGGQSAAPKTGSAKQGADLSDPWEQSAKGTPGAGGPLVGKLKAGFKGRK